MANNKVIYVSGCGGSGKTTTIATIKKDLNQKGIKCMVIPEQARLILDEWHCSVSELVNSHDKEAYVCFQYECWKRTTAAIKNGKTSLINGLVDVLIIDRHPVEMAAYFSLWAKCNYIEKWLYKRECLKLAKTLSKYNPICYLLPIPMKQKDDGKRLCGYKADEHNLIESYLNQIRGLPILLL